MSEMMPYRNSRAGGRPTAPVNQNRFALIGRISYEEFQARQIAQDQPDSDENNIFPWGKVMADELLHVRESEAFVARRHPFSSSNGPANMLPGFTSLNGMFFSKLQLQKLREVGEMGSDDDLIEQVFFAQYYIAGFAGVNSDYLPLADRTTTEAGFDVRGHRDFLNLTKRRLCVGDQLRGRLPTAEESRSRPNIEGRDRRKETIVIDRLEPFKTRADREHVAKQLGLDDTARLKDPFYRPGTQLGAALDALRTNSQNASSNSTGAHAQRDRYAEAYRDHNSLSGLQAIRVFVELMVQNNPLLAGDIRGAVERIDLEKVVGLAEVQVSDPVEKAKYTLGADAVKMLKKDQKWKEPHTIFAHRAILSLSTGVDMGETYPGSKSMHSLSLQKYGSVHMMGRANEAQSRYRESSLGLCTKGCDPMNYGDILIQKNQL